MHILGKSKFPSVFNLIIILVSSTYVGLFLHQVVRMYSPIPFWDDWSGYINFYLEEKAGKANFWSQYSEHRLVISRILTWIDFHLLDGLRWPILCIYFICILFTWILILKILFLKVNFISRTSRDRLFVMTLPVTLFLFSFIQYENFEFAMNAGFYCSLVLPLSGLYLQFYLYSKNYPRNTEIIFHVSAFLCFITAPLALANGLIAPFIGAISIYFMGKSLRGLFLYLASGSIIAYIYFWNYSSVTVHADPFESLIHHFPLVIKFSITLIGSPFVKLTNSYFLSAGIATVEVIVLLVATIKIFRSKYKTLNERNLDIAIVLMAYFCLFSATVTALGRVNFGNGQALASRYSSISLLFSSLIWLLLCEYFRRSSRSRRSQLIIFTTLLVITFFNSQIKERPYQALRNFQLNTSALAIQLGIEDKNIFASVFPNSATPFTLGGVMIKEHKTILGSEIMRDWPRFIDQNDSSISVAKCYGWIDQIEPSVVDRYRKISGWYDSKKVTAGQYGLIRLIDKKDRIVGLAIHGAPRGDAADFLGSPNENIGYVGFILNSTEIDDIRISNANIRCDRPLHR